MRTINTKKDWTEKSIEGYCFGFIKSGGGPSKYSQDKCREKEAKHAEHLMTELDQQYEGGTAPCLPSTSSFRSNERDTHKNKNMYSSYFDFFYRNSHVE